MLLGIDVGGTHTDAVLLQINGTSFTVVAAVKTATDPDDVVSSVKAALDAVFAANDPAAVSRFTLSTTLTTNALAQGRFGNTRLVLVPGPGMAVDTWTRGLPVTVLAGSIDHRGRETSPLDEKELAALAESIAEEGVTGLAVAGKFATRNPEHENRIREVAVPARSDARSGAGSGVAVSLSHTLSGMLNFPRRAVTAFYNAAIRDTHDAFVNAVLAVCGGVGSGVEPLLLMAHGGSVPINASRNVCVEAANSGPAASVLGVLALEGEKLGAKTVLFCDIGGSTTDLAVLANGSPVTAREGITLGGRRTSVPGLATWSVPVGGDCPVILDGNGTIDLDPRRQGPCRAVGGPVPTLTDALNVLGYASFGDTALSRAGLEDIARAVRERAGAQLTVEEIARETAFAAGRRIKEAADAFLAGINARPVYTVAQLLEGVAVAPASLCAVGGGGESLAPVLEEVFSLPVAVPGHAPFANAVGAALARVSAYASLYADTARNVAYLLPKGERLNVSSSYTQKEAENAVAAWLEREAAALDPAVLDRAGTVQPVEIVESDAFSMHDERGNRIGRTIRVAARLKPGLVVDG